MSDQEDRVEISYVPDDDPADHPDEKPKEEKTAATKKQIPKKRTTVKKLQKELDEQEKQVEKAIEERDEFKDLYMRNLAEMDNFRKRVKKEKEDYQKYVLSEFLLELLQVYDNLERALKAKGSNENVSSDHSIVSGVEMIYKQFSDLLKKYNVTEIDAMEKPFDPNVHQALSKEEREDITEPTIVEVYQKGFLYNGKLLKPTLAKVAIPMEKPEEPGNSDNSEEDGEQ